MSSKAKTPRVFFDASIRNNCIGIGIYEMTTNDSTSITIQCSYDMVSSKAEEIALRQALEYSLTKYKSKTVKLFTDNFFVYRANREVFELFNSRNNTDITLHWIPRELNTEADRLSKLGSKGIKGASSTPIVGGIRSFIMTKSIEQRVALLRNIFKKQHEIDFLNNFLNNKSVKGKGKGINKLLTFIRSIFKNEELSKINKNFTRNTICILFKNNLILSDKDIEKILRN